MHRALFGEAIAGAGPSSRSRSLQILVADGYTDAADSLALLVQLWGHQVLVARTGAEALAAAAELPIDLVLAELVLPVMDGFELARRLRDRTTLVAVTGISLPAYRRRALEAGFARVLIKPVSPDELEQLVQAIAALKR
jgi:CheY-like chemotaxis protein